MRRRSHKYKIRRATKRLGKAYEEFEWVNSCAMREGHLPDVFWKYDKRILSLKTFLKKSGVSFKTK